MTRLVRASMTRLVRLYSYKEGTEVNSVPNESFRNHCRVITMVPAASQWESECEVRSQHS